MQSTDYIPEIAEDDEDDRYEYVVNEFNHVQRPKAFIEFYSKMELPRPIPKMVKSDARLAKVLGNHVVNDLVCLKTNTIKYLRTNTLEQLQTFVAQPDPCQQQRANEIIVQPGQCKFSVDRKMTRSQSALFRNQIDQYFKYDPPK